VSSLSDDSPSYTGWLTRVGADGTLPSGGGVAERSRLPDVSSGPFVVLGDIRPANFISLKIVGALRPCPCPMGGRRAAAFGRWRGFGRECPG